MTARSGRGRGPTATSPWPLLVAIGLATAELGVLTGFVPVAVAGLVLLGGSGAGLVHEVGYGSSMARTIVVAGCLFLVLGGTLWVVGASDLSVSALAAAPGTDPLALRGLATVAAGGLLVALGIVRSISSTGRV